MLPSPEGAAETTAVAPGGEQQAASGAKAQVPKKAVSVAATAYANEPPVDLWDRMRRGMAWEIPDNPQVHKARAHYLGQHNYLEALGPRSTLYLHYIVDEVERRGMPMELALLPLVESSLNPFARSSQQALGLWQIMPDTGRQLGITSDWWYDGRRDLRDSTAAALDYLQTLHDSLDGDWMLAIAAYNGGIGRVGRAVRANEAKGRGTDFWSLPLPRETRAYVPRLLALTSMVSEPDTWAVTLPPLANAPAFVAVPTGGQIELARAAELADIELAHLQALNPGHRRWATAPAAVELLLPPESAVHFAQRLAALDANQRVNWQHYTIRSGDTLGAIARRFDTQVALLQAVNKLNGTFIRAGKSLMIPQGGDWAANLAQRNIKEPRETGYKVRRGDSLYRIAGLFKVSIDDIIAWNALNPRGHIYPGQQLTLYVGDS